MDRPILNSRTQRLSQEFESGEGLRGRGEPDGGQKPQKTWIEAEQFCISDSLSRAQFCRYFKIYPGKERAAATSRYPGEAEGDVRSGVM